MSARGADAKRQLAFSKPHTQQLCMLTQPSHGYYTQSVHTIRYLAAELPCIDVIPIKLNCISTAIHSTFCIVSTGLGLVSPFLLYGVTGNGCSSSQGA